MLCLTVVYCRDRKEQGTVTLGGFQISGHKFFDQLRLSVFTCCGPYLQFGTYVQKLHQYVCEVNSLYSDSVFSPAYVNFLCSPIR